MIRRGAYFLAAALLHSSVLGSLWLLFEPDPACEARLPVRPDRTVTVRLQVGSAPQTQVRAAAAAEQREAPPSQPEADEGTGTRRVQEPSSVPRTETARAERSDDRPKPAAEEGADGVAKTEAKTPKGRYPSQAARRGWEGTVRLRFRIAPDGSCAEVRVVKSSGYRLLDEDAVRVVSSTWRFPAEDAGKDVAFAYTYCLKCGDGSHCPRH